MILPCPYNLGLEMPPEDKAATERSFAEAQALFNDIVRDVVEKLTPIIAPIVDHITAIVRNLAATVSDVLPSVVEAAFAAYPNKRVVHLAKYGHGRTKKKNIHRILKWYQRGAR